MSGPQAFGSDPAFAALLARAVGPVLFGSLAQPDGSVADDGNPATPDADDVTRGAVHEILAAVLDAGGRRWAARGDQDLWHEGADSESPEPNPVRLDTLVRDARRDIPGGLPADRKDAAVALARAAIERTRGWSAGHFLHLFGVAVTADELLKSLDDPPPPEPVNYFRRVEYAERAFSPGQTVMSGSHLPLDVRRVFTDPHHSDATRTLYARTSQQYQIPPAPGERSEAHA